MNSLSDDDLLSSSNDLEFLEWLKIEFCGQVKMEECGQAYVCLDLEIRRDRSKTIVHIRQRRYAEMVLERFEMTHAKLVFRLCLTRLR